MAQAAPSQVALPLVGVGQGVHEAPQKATLVLETQVPRHAWLPAKHCTAVEVAVAVSVADLVSVWEVVAVVEAVRVAEAVSVAETVAVAAVVSVADVVVAVATPVVATAVAVVVAVVLVVVTVPVGCVVEVVPASIGASPVLGPKGESAASARPGNGISGLLTPQATNVSPTRTMASAGGLARATRSIMGSSLARIPPCRSGIVPRPANGQKARATWGGATL
jgi:hypothetical protein